MSLAELAHKSAHRRGWVGAINYIYRRRCALTQTIVVRLGVIGRERFQYWRLLAWTLFVRPRLLPQAVTLAIYGYHFRRVAELHVL
ncbi:MAG: DUF4070 domain-containing protein [Gemmatimonadaceae bacterium]